MFCAAGTMPLSGNRVLVKLETLTQTVSHGVLFTPHPVSPPMSSCFVTTLVNDGDVRILPMLCFFKLLIRFHNVSDMYKILNRVSD